MVDLPIDYHERPWKDKYLDEETPMFNGWFIFGQSSGGGVDICDKDSVIFTNVPVDVAHRIIRARDIFTRAIVREIGLSSNPYTPQRNFKP